jgi:hypothetical protein
MVKTFIQAAFILALLFSAVGCSKQGGISMEITFPKDGAILATNLVKLTGTVSDLKTNVAIHYGSEKTEATVSENGSFYSWVDLPKGANTIEVIAANGKESASKTVNVTFKPPLAVYVDGPPSQGITVSDNTVMAVITGYISDPQAKVTVSSLKVDARKEGNTLYTPVLWDEIIRSVTAQVDKDGLFSAKIPLGYQPDAELATYYVIKAKAERGAEKDEDYTGIFRISKNGEFRSTINRSGPSPINPIFPAVNSMNLKPGEKKYVPLLLNVKKDILSPELPRVLSYKITGVDKEYSEVKAPVTEGLKVYLSPSTFTIWTNVNYSPDLIIETTNQVPPGKYWFYTVYYLNDKIWYGGWCSITVR